MLNRIKAKLNNTKGESLVETLVALMISAISIATLVLMIDTSGRLITGSIDKMNTYYTEEDKLVRQNGDGRGATVLIENGSSPVNLKAGNKSEGEESSRIPISVFENKTLKENVLSYRKRNE